MKKGLILAANVAALAIVACSESPEDVTAPDLQVSAIRNPTPTLNPNGPVWVLGDLTVDVEISGSFDPGNNSHPQHKGTCRNDEGVETGTAADTVWYNDSNHATGAAFCSGSSGIAATQQCSVDSASLPATYAFGTGGQGVPAETQSSSNENINFHSELITQDSAQFVHYTAPTRRNPQGLTTGKSYTAFSMTCDDESQYDGYISLYAFNDYAGNLFSGAGPGDRALDVGAVDQIDVVMFATGEGPADISTGTADDPFGTGTLTQLYWNFRSRN